MTQKKPELLLPAGSFDRLKTAFLYGADAVYAGMPSVSLRNKTSWTTDELKQGIAYAHTLNKKVYLTINLFTHNNDIPRLNTFIDLLPDLNPDGLIVADPGVFRQLKEQVPDIPLHISTQANVCSSLTVQFWQEQGASLCVLGREVPLTEISQIRQDCPDIRLETFIHGALCVSYSGRCLLSNFMTGRSANKGNCAHSCRWRYKTYEQKPVHPDYDSRFFISEETRPRDLMQIDEDEHGTYIMNSRDLCLMPRLDKLLPIGIDSFKIEGRNKSEYYTAVTAHTYRHAIDDWFQNPQEWAPDKYMDELMTLQSRGYTLGFIDGNAGPEAQNYDVSASVGDWRYAGRVLTNQTNLLTVEVKHKLTKGMTVTALSPFEFTPITFSIHDLYDSQSGQSLDEISSGRPGQSVQIPVSSEISKKLPPLSVIRTRLF